MFFNRFQRSSFDLVRELSMSSDMRSIPSPFESILGKLMRAGWISASGAVDREGIRTRGVLWTDTGLTRSVAIAIFLEELGELSDDEWRCFRRLIREHARELE